MEYTINELTSMISETDEDVRDCLFQKYSYIIKIVLNKYSKGISKYNIDYEEAKQEALLAFDDGLNNYREEKDASLATFLTLIIDRRISKFIRNYPKKEISELSLNYLNSQNVELINLLKDDKYDPISKTLLSSKQNELLSFLSKREKEVYILKMIGYKNDEIEKLLNGDRKMIYNINLRLKNKAKDIFDF